MVKKFKTVTPSLKSTFLEAREANVRKMDANEVKINGKDITTLMGFNLPNDYPKLVSRCELPKDEFWGLYDDYGYLLYFNNSDKITNGYALFEGKKVKQFLQPLSSLTNGEHMFGKCSQLKEFESDLNSLSDGTHMFSFCNNLTQFTNDMKSLSNGEFMFGNCYKLTSFVGDLDSLKTAPYMFSDCEKLSVFDSDLSSLEDGRNMFLNCSLNAQSVETILTSLPTYNSGSHKIYLSIEDTDEAKNMYNLITGNKQNISMELGCGYSATVSYKGWTVDCSIHNPSFNPYICGGSNCGYYCC